MPRIPIDLSATPAPDARSEQRYAVGRAYRDGSLICGRVHVKIARDDRLGLAPHERRRYVAARFLDRVHPDLRADWPS